MAGNERFLAEYASGMRVAADSCAAANGDLDQVKTDLNGWAGDDEIRQKVAENIEVTLYEVASGEL